MAARDCPKDKRGMIVFQAKALRKNADAKAALARCMANHEGFHLEKLEQKEFLWKLEE